MDLIYYIGGAMIVLVLLVTECFTADFIKDRELFWRDTDKE
jgi:hypothetical protein